MKTVAFLWWENEVKWDKDRPFGDKEWKNKDYAEYTEMLEEKDLKVVCGEYRWYYNGEMEKSFHWNGEKWEKVENVEIDGVYDLFRHDKEKYELKKQMQNQVEIINDPEVAELCQDKLNTYEEFQSYIPETREASEENIREMSEKYDRVIVKPRYGSSGEGIEVIEEYGGEDFGDDMLVQRFIESDDLPEYGIEGPHDLRVLVVNGEPIGSYFRVPDEGLLSNVALGGSKIYVELGELDEEVLEIVDKVGEKLEAYNPSIYTVDFMYSSERPWIIELNSQPGVYYYGDGREEEWERPWMKKIVEAITEV